MTLELRGSGVPGQRGRQGLEESGAVQSPHRCGPQHTPTVGGGRAPGKGQNLTGTPGTPRTVKGLGEGQKCPKPGQEL